MSNSPAIPKTVWPTVLVPAPPPTGEPFLTLDRGNYLYYLSIRAIADPSFDPNNSENFQPPVPHYPLTGGWYISSGTLDGTGVTISFNDDIMRVVNNSGVTIGLVSINDDGSNDFIGSAVDGAIEFATLSRGVRYGMGAIGGLIHITIEQPLITPPSGPPASAPIVTSMEVSSPGDVVEWSTFGQNIVQLKLDPVKMFPFNIFSSLYHRDGTVRNFNNEVDVRSYINATTDLFIVTSCYPTSNLKELDVPVTVTAYSNSNNSPVTATYVIRIVANLDSARILLDDLMERSGAYVNDIVSGVPSGNDAEQLLPNTSERIEPEVFVPDIDDIETSIEEYEFNLDELIEEDPLLTQDNLNKLNNESPNESLIDMIRNRITPLEQSSDTVENEDCWCDPTLGIEEIRRRIGKCSE